MSNSNNIYGFGALAGLTIVDCSQVLAGPFCSMLLADMGADVIKVEKPDGDEMRQWGPPFLGGESAAFMAINRNKRGITLDIKSAQGAQDLIQLVKKADVFIENYRFGALERYGFGYKQLAEINPSLIYCSISGFGRTGPYAKLPGYDLIAQGMSGLMSITGNEGMPPAKVGVPIADLNAGMFAALGIVSACFARERSNGKGQFIDISLLESAVSYIVWESSIYFATREVMGPLGSSHRLTAPYQAVKCKDGYITLGAPNQNMWERLCDAIDRTDLIKDKRFSDNGSRMRNRASLITSIEHTLATDNRDYWLSVLKQQGLPCGPIFSMDELWSNEQIQSRDMVVTLEHPKAGSVENIGVPIKMSQTQGKVTKPSPTLGQHTEEVLKEFGLW